MTKIIGDKQEEAEAYENLQEVVQRRVKTLR